MTSQRTETRPQDGAARQPQCSRNRPSIKLAGPAVTAIAAITPIIAIAVAALFPISAAAASAAPAAAKEAGDSPTIKEVLARSIAARGGIEKLKAVTTRRESGRLALAAGAEWPFVIDHKRPHSYLIEIDLQAAKLVRAFDGVHGWQMQPQNKVADQMAYDDQRNMANDADFDFCGPLVETNIKGKAELVGREPYDGHDAWRVKIVQLSGDVSYFDLDATTYLPLHWEGARWINGKPVLFESSYADYREVDGIKYPFLVLSWQKGSNQKQKRVFNKIENNPSIDDSRFAMPANATPPPPPAPVRAAPTGAVPPVTKTPSGAAPSGPATAPMAPMAPMAPIAPMTPPATTPPATTPPPGI
jgi:hypothetical protein